MCVDIGATRQRLLNSKVGRFSIDIKDPPLTRRWKKVHFKVPAANFDVIYGEKVGKKLKRREIPKDNWGG